MFLDVRRSEPHVAGSLGRTHRHRSRLWALTLLVVAGCETIPPKTPTPVSPARQGDAPSGMRTHRVFAGETLWSISQRYGVSPESLQRVNRVADPGQVPVGAMLVIPSPAPPPALPKIDIPLPRNRRWTHIVIHHSATEVDNAPRINRSHRRRGFKHGLGYHFVINNGTAGRRNGQLEVGHRWRQQLTGAHCNAGGMNEHGIGICLIGDFMGREPSAAQMATLEALVKRLQAHYRIPMARVIRHGDVRGKRTACPGDRFPWARLRARLRGA
jgi:LysM repeat protein